MKAVLVLNCGSSSAKFAVITEEKKETVISGLAERLGSEHALLTIKVEGKKIQQSIANADHEQALLAIVNQLKNYADYDIVAVGHRVVHGGEYFSSSCVIDDKVLMALQTCSQLAPLHNPPNIAGIQAAQKAYPNLPQVAVFDTAFHQTLPETSYLYAIPYEYYQQYSVRRYGFHGISFRYINQAITDYHAGESLEKVIVAHLGNGASICAIENGRSVAVSTGFTPLDGLIQGTRCGQIDPAIVSFLVEKTGKKVQVITDELWKKSGLLGLSQVTNDCRELEEKAAGGDKGCQRALSVFSARISEIIGAYASVMNGVDAIVFTGGIGENSDMIRAAVVSRLQYLGFVLNDEKNQKATRGNDGIISDLNSKPIWVIPTSEEAMIAEDVFALI